jgi:List-Bact-rpt repeat protein
MECGAVPVGDLSSAETAAHELLHSLGATLPGAPHVCNGGHVCDSASDILYQFLNPGSTLDVVTLDFGRDDYYGHSGSWWDVQDSAWLTRLPTHAFSATIVGSGTLVARVGSTVLPCENGCTGLTLDSGTGAVVAALPAPGWAIGSWSGSCTGTSPDCVIDGNGDVSATVTFVRAPIVVQLHVVGKGRVTSTPTGLSCTSTCRKSFAAATTVRLKATAATGWKFAGFQGGCTGRTCTITDPVAPVQARFVRTHR